MKLIKTIAIACIEMFFISTYDLLCTSEFSILTPNIKSSSAVENSLI